MTKLYPATDRQTPGGSPDPMHPIETQVHVDYHLASLTSQARLERLASSRRRSHAGEHVAHPNLDHRHAPAGVRGAVGRLLIGLGIAIAGSAPGPEAGAGRPA